MLTSKFYAACLSAALLCSPLAFAENAHPLVREKNLEMAEISEKSLFRELYADVMTSAYLDEESELARSLKKMPYVGIRANPQEQEQVAFMHRPQIYYNAKGEKRALVMVEKHRVEEGGRLVECHACAPEVDLFVLAPQDQGWRLLSSTKVQSEISGSFGDTHFKMSAMPVLLDTETVGILYESGYGNQGTFETMLYAVVLHEKRPIQNYEVAKLSFSNEGYYGDDSPQAYSFEGEYTQAERPDSKGRYPIEIRYTGENVGETGRIRPFNQIQRFVFNRSRNRFEQVR